MPPVCMLVCRTLLRFSLNKGHHGLLGAAPMIVGVVLRWRGWCASMVVAAVVNHLSHPRERPKGLGDRGVKFGTASSMF